MGSKGDCLDNAAMESFHASLKKDLIHRRSWPTRQQARTAVFAYIETFYNRRRRHSTLGMLCPVEFEARYAAAQQLSRGRARARPREKTAKLCITLRVTHSTTTTTTPVLSDLPNQPLSTEAGEFQWTNNEKTGVVPQVGVGLRSRL